MIKSNLPRLRTPGVIAAEIGEPLSRVLYVLRTRHHIAPVATAGRLRLYERDAVDLIRREINDMDGRSAQPEVPNVV